MNKNMITVIASVLLSGLTAFGIVKANQPAAEQNAATTTYSIDGSAYRTVNLAQDNYPDFTYAAESAVDAVVFVKVTIKSTQEYYIDPFFKFFFGDQMPQAQENQFIRVYADTVLLGVAHKEQSLIRFDVGLTGGN